MSEAADRLRGIIAALPTPFDAGGFVDEPAVRRLVGWLIAGGIDGVFVCGTTGESALLAGDERAAVVKAAAEAAAGRAPVIAHVGAPSTAQVLELAYRCRDAGADVLAAVPPYCSRCGDAEVAAHFAALAGAVPDRPVLLYNIPQLTVNAVTPAVVTTLSPVPNIVGLKDSSGDLDGLLRIAGSARPGFRLIVGTDLLAVQAAALGWPAIVSGPASAVPAPYVALWDARARGSWAELSAAYRTITRVVAAVRNGNIAWIKAVLALRGLAGPSVRPPLRPLTDSEQQALRAELQDLLPGEGF
ncbi:MAG: dihydrodipicolinate synthase family protein [Armatimonadota bacterium]|nr:dihydrodipicolinate synthase family protein [Armatimonadota bacterium]